MLAERWPVSYLAREGGAYLEGSICNTHTSDWVKDSSRRKCCRLGSYLMVEEEAAEGSVACHLRHSLPALLARRGTSVWAYSYRPRQRRQQHLRRPPGLMQETAPLQWIACFRIPRAAEEGCWAKRKRQLPHLLSSSTPGTASLQDWPFVELLQVRVITRRAGGNHAGWYLCYTSSFSDTERWKIATLYRCSFLEQFIRCCRNEQAHAKLSLL